MKRIILAFILCSLTFMVQAQEITESEKATLEQRVKEQIDDFISYLPEIAGKSGKPYQEKVLAQKYIKSGIRVIHWQGRTISVH